jgi:hypothetical protein
VFKFSFFWKNVIAKVVKQRGTYGANPGHKVFQIFADAFDFDFQREQGECVSTEVDPESGRATPGRDRSDSNPMTRPDKHPGLG